MRRIFTEETLLSMAALLLLGVSPHLFPAAQAGTAKLSELAVWFLVPSVALLVVLLAVAARRDHVRLVNRLLAGGAAGLVATLGLEAVRATSFHFGGMPGDLPRLLGVLLTDRFMLGPSVVSDILGWTYHFWNGACFGMIFAVLAGRGSVLLAVTYAELIGIGFLLGPAVKSLGIGFMGSDMPAMPITVVVAHLIYGLILAVACRRWVHEAGWLLSAKPRAARLSRGSVPRVSPENSFRSTPACSTGEEL